MNVADLQQWLVGHGQSITVDGKGGPQTRAAILAAFTNRNASAVNENDIVSFASALGCTTKQLRAVAQVESAGSGFTSDGRPKILFERHIFHRLTDGKWSVSSFSNPTYGGYKEDSWEKLTQAACRDPDAAFSSASWGKFQIMGSHWRALDYRSPAAMAWTMTQSEGDHYEALSRFIKANNLTDKLRRISTSPDDNRPFCRAYNGPAYERNDYHNKLARAMR